VALPGVWSVWYSRYDVGWFPSEFIGVCNAVEVTQKIRFNKGAQQIVAVITVPCRLIMG